MRRRRIEPTEAHSQQAYAMLEEIGALSYPAHVSLLVMILRDIAANGDTDWETIKTWAPAARAAALETWPNFDADAAAAADQDTSA